MGMDLKFGARNDLIIIGYITVILFLSGCNIIKGPNKISDIFISLSLVKDVNPSLIEKINKDIALCYHPPRWEPETKTMYLAKRNDGNYWWQTNVEPIQNVHEWVLMEFKNIGRDTIILLGSPVGHIFSSWYFFDIKNDIYIDYFNNKHIDKDPRIVFKENFPCPITLKPKESYYFIDFAPHPLQNSSSMFQFLYYKQNIDSVFKYWLVMPEMKITNNSLELLQKYKSKLTAERYNSHMEMFTYYYINPKEVLRQDSLVKLWIND